MEACRQLFTLKLGANPFAPSPKRPRFRRARLPTGLGNRPRAEDSQNPGSLLRFAPGPSRRC
jgi:hypothetical protein